MNKMTIFAGAVSFFAASVVHAATDHVYTVFGNLVSYNVISSGGVVEAYTLYDPTQPALEANGAQTAGNNANFSIGTSGAATFNISLQPEYHVALIGSGGVLGNITYSAFAQNVEASTVAGMIFDPATRHLTGTGSSTSVWGIGSWCTASATICSRLYSENLASGIGTFDLYFDSSLQTFTGSVTIDSLLKDGSSIHRVYNVSAVPVPVAGVLFGSALLGLVGARRRKS